jgi:thiamine-phosphate pyrophosphorylase
LERLTVLEASKLEGVYAITDAALLPQETLKNRVEAALQAGLCLLQYRNKKDLWSDRVAQAQELAALCQRYNTPLLINDDVDLCLEVGAAGVHIGQGDEGLISARSRLGDRAIIGVTCHDRVDLAIRAQEDGATYAAFGRFFPSRTKPEAPPASIETLLQASESLRVPIVAIGGINAENGAILLEAGANILAVINYVFAHADAGARVTQLKALFNQDH